MVDTADNRGGYCVEVAVAQTPQLPLQLFKLSLGWLQVYTIHLNAEYSPHLGASLYHQQPPRHLQSLLAPTNKVER